jgi:hypothetical protein
MASTNDRGSHHDCGDDLRDDRRRGYPGNSAHDGKLGAAGCETSGHRCSWSRRGCCDTAGCTAGRDPAGRTNARHAAARDAAHRASADGASGTSRSCSHAASPGCATRERGSASTCADSGGCDPMTTPQRRAQDRRLELARNSEREEERECCPLTANLVLKRGAAGTAIDMGARHAARPDLHPDRR